MRIEVARADLNRVLASVIKVVEVRSTVPILQNVVLTAADGALTARGTDMDIEIAVTTEYKGDPGVACVSARSLADIVKRLPGDTVSLELVPGVAEDTGDLIIKSGRSRFKLPSFPSRFFPSLAVPTYDHEFTVNLGELVSHVVFAVAVNTPDRSWLEGIYLHQVGDKLRAVGADSPHCVVFSTDMPEGATDVSAILPRKVADLAASFKAPVDVSLCDTRIRLRSPGTEICAKLIEGKYADYERAIPAERERIITANKADLRAAAERVGVVSSEASGKPIRLNIAPGSIHLVASDKDGRDAVDEIAVEYAGEPTFLAFNVRILDEMLAAVPGDEVILDFTNNSMSTRVRSKSDANFVGALSPFPCGCVMYNISFSGGIGSAVSALAAHRNGLPFRLIFSDVKMEDPDLYRFNSDVAEAVGQQIVVLTDGRDPWDVFEDKRYIGNTRVAHCSKVLKTDRVMEWLDANTAPDEPLVLGMDWSEMDRIERAQRVWAPRQVVSLLIQLKVTRPTYSKWLADYGIRQPSLYDAGFPHNNCGGACVKQGLQGWATLLEKYPERFAAAEDRMNLVMERIGPTARPFLRLTRNKVTTYLTLTEFRVRYQAGKISIDPYVDGHGGCGCFTDDTGHEDLFLEEAA